MFKYAKIRRRIPKTFLCVANIYTVYAKSEAQKGEKGKKNKWGVDNKQSALRL